MSQVLGIKYFLRTLPLTPIRFWDYSGISWECCMRQVPEEALAAMDADSE